MNQQVELLMVRIVFFIGELGKGGSERQLYLLLKHLDQSRFEAHVVVFNPGRQATYQDALRAVGVQVHALPEDCKGVAARVFYLVRLLKPIQPHIIHSWTVHDNPYAALVGYLLGVHVRIGSMRASLQHTGYASLPRWAQWLCLNSTPFLMVNAQATLDQVRARGVREQRIFCLRNCVEVCQSVEPSGVRPDHRIIGTVGNIRANKNHHLFVEMIHRTVAKFPEVQGVIIGQCVEEEAAYAEAIAQRITALGLQEHVRLVGFVDEAHREMESFEIFCLFSQYEGTPNVILEAMAAGKPVVATRVGGIPEVVEHGVSGLLVEPGDVDGFAAAVGQLLGDKGLARRMGQAGLAFIQEGYTCDLVVTKLQRYYTNLLAQVE